MPRDLPANLPTLLVPSTLSHLQISLSSWRQSHEDIDCLAIGALIFRHLPSQPIQILLLKRASTDSFPNVWEPPGGSVDPEDNTLLDAVVREVWEEAGLRVKGFQTQVWDRVWGEGETPVEVQFPGRGGQRWCKLNFLVDVVEGEAVSLDELEHQDSGWFERAEVEKLPFVSEQGKDIVLNGFKAFAEKESSARGRQ